MVLVQNMHPSLKQYRDEFIRMFGRSPMEASQIDKIGKEIFGTYWGGVYPQDAVPKLKAGHFYIVNTGFAKGRGVHWTAIAVSAKGIPHLWDSFGRNLHSLLWKEEQKIRGSGIKPVETHHKADQKGHSAICGQLSLAWLCVVKNDGFRIADRV